MSCFWRNAGTKYINTYIYAYCKIQYSICIRHQRWDVNICAIGCTFSYLSVWLLPTSWWKLFSGSQAIARSPEEGIDICNDAGDEKTSGGLVTPTIKTRVRQYQGSRTIYYFRFIFSFSDKDTMLSNTVVAAPMAFKKKTCRREMDHVLIMPCFYGGFGFWLPQSMRTIHVRSYMLVSHHGSLQNI